MASQTGVERGAAPVVWVLTDDRPGNTTQSAGLARALGWPYEIKELQFTPLARTFKRLFGPFAATRRGLDLARSATLTPPWPDVLIATGWRPAQVARWIKKQSRGHTRTIQMGRKGAYVAGLFDIVVTCSYFRLPPHPQRIEIAAPLTQVTPERLAQAAARWRHLFDSSPHPHVMLLIGGATSRHQWDATIARRLGEEVRAFAQAAGGSVFAITSRRTGGEATEALVQGLGEAGHIHRWQPDQPDNPYLGYLALADVLVVTGESESMLAEVAAAGKPLYIYPLPAVERLPRLKTRLKARLKDWAVTHAYRPCASSEEGNWFQHLQTRLARVLIANGTIRPRRDLHELHNALVRKGVARLFAGPLETWEHPPLREVEEIAHRVRELLGRGEP
jgi:mitochondrial fission protein ELM1